MHMPGSPILRSSARRPDRRPLCGVDFSTVDGVAFSGTVARIDFANTSTCDYPMTASIDWGDGASPSTGTVVVDSCELPELHAHIEGAHTYATLGTYPVSVTWAGFEVLATASVAVAPKDLALSVGTSPNPLRTTTKLNYTITVLNASGGTASGVQVIDTLPTQAQFVSYASSQGSCVAPVVGATGTMTCSLGSLSGATTATVIVVVKVVASGNTTITNSASVSAKSIPPTPTTQRPS